MRKSRIGKHRIEILLNHEEYEELKKQKEFLGFTTFSKLIRTYIHTGICYRIDYSALYEVATQISRVGNNINQIAAVANTDKSIKPEQIELVLKELKEIKDILGDDVLTKAKITRQLNEDFFIKAAASFDTAQSDGRTDGQNGDN